MKSERHYASRPWELATGLLVAAIGLASCADSKDSKSAPPAQSAPDRIDWVASLALRQADRLEIIPGDPAGGEKREWTERERIQRLLDLASGEANLEPAVRCMADARLVFHFTDGRQEILFLSCLGKPDRISGNQAVWKGKQAKVSMDFLRALSDSPPPTSRR